MTPKEVKNLVVTLTAIPYADFVWNKNNVNNILKQYHRPSYVKAGLYILLWWNTARGEYIETDRDEIFPSNWETPPTSFFYQEWSKACKKAGLHVA